MKDLWYGDRRDRVKWGGLIYLAESHEIRTILQVVYLRTHDKRELNCGNSRHFLSEAVWAHFSNLKDIQRLAQACNLTISVFDNSFDPTRRRDYIREVISELSRIGRSKILFLDPDTGISIKSTKAQYVIGRDIEELWKILKQRDILAVYQHGDHSKDWLNRKIDEFERAIGSDLVESIVCPDVAKDVAIMWCKKA